MEVVVVATAEVTIRAVTLVEAEMAEMQATRRVMVVTVAGAKLWMWRIRKYPLLKHLHIFVFQSFPPDL